MTGEDAPNEFSAEVTGEKARRRPLPEDFLPEIPPNLSDGEWLKAVRKSLSPHGWSQYELADEMVLGWLREYGDLPDLLERARPDKISEYHARIATLRSLMEGLFTIADRRLSSGSDPNDDEKSTEDMDAVRDEVAKLRSRLAAVEAGRTKLKPIMRQEIEALRRRVVRDDLRSAATQSIIQHNRVNEKGSDFEALQWGYIPRKTSPEELEAIDEVQGFNTLSVSHHTWQGQKLIMTVNRDHSLWPLISVGEIIIFAHGFFPSAGHLGLFLRDNTELVYGVLHLVNGNLYVFNAKNLDPSPFDSRWRIYGYAMHREYTLETVARDDSPFFYKPPLQQNLNLDT